MYVMSLSHSSVPYPPIPHSPPPLGRPPPRLTLSTSGETALALLRASTETLAASRIPSYVNRPELLMSAMSCRSVNKEGGSVNSEMDKE